MGSDTVICVMLPYILADSSLYLQSGCAVRPVSELPGRGHLGPGLNPGKAVCCRGLSPLFDSWQFKHLNINKNELSEFGRHTLMIAERKDCYLGLYLRRKFLLIVLMRNSGEYHLYSCTVSW